MAILENPRKQFAIRRAFEGLAFVTSHYKKIDPKSEDADDYIETMIVTESLIERGTLDHRDLVARYYRGRNVQIAGEKVILGGNKNPQSQIAKLRASQDPFYLAEDGITDGAAMKMLGPALYFPDWKELVYGCNYIARITHGSPEARLAAILVAVRIRLAALQTFNNTKNDLEDCIQHFANAAELVGLSNAAQVFLFLLKNTKPELKDIAEKVGFLHVSTSTPVAAVLASYAEDSLTSKFMNGGAPKVSHTIPGVEVTPYESVIERHRKIFGMRGYAEHVFAARHDSDTFFSILVPIEILAGRAGSEAPIKHEIFERWDTVAEKLAARWP